MTILTRSLVVFLVMNFCNGMQLAEKSPQTLVEIPEQSSQLELRSDRATKQHQGVSLVDVGEKIADEDVQSMQIVTKETCGPEGKQDLIWEGIEALTTRGTTQCFETAMAMFYLLTGGKIDPMNTVPVVKLRKTEADAAVADEKHAMKRSLSHTVTEKGDGMYVMMLLNTRISHVLSFLVEGEDVFIYQSYQDKENLKQYMNKGKFHITKLEMKIALDNLVDLAFFSSNFWDVVKGRAFFNKLATFNVDWWYATGVHEIVMWHETARILDRVGELESDQIQPWSREWARCVVDKEPRPVAPTIVNEAGHRVLAGPPVSCEAAILAKLP